MSIDCVIKADAVGLHQETPFSTDQTIASLRNRFYAMTGFEPKSMRFTVNGSAVEDETLPLQSYITSPDVKVLTIEITGKSEFGDLEDVDQVKKYELDDNVYDKMEGTIRDMKRKAGIPVKGEKKPSKYDEPITGINVGDRCEVELADHSHHRGEVMYVGKLEPDKGYWVGIKLDEPYGKHDGTHGGKRYFTCDDKYGVFVRGPKVKVGDYPEIDWDKELEDEM